MGLVQIFSLVVLCYSKKYEKVESLNNKAQNMSHEKLIVKTIFFFFFHLVAGLTV